MSYFQKITLAALLNVFSATLSATLGSDSDDNPFDPFSQTSISLHKNIKRTTNPDEIYQQVLQNQTASKTAFIIDVDGTITQDPTPSKYKIAIQQGEAVKNIRELIKEGALVVFCSAWNYFNESIERLRQVGFEEQNFTTGNEKNLLIKGAINMQFPNIQNVNLIYYQYGRIISVQNKELISKDPYFRNKAFSLMLLSPNLLEDIEKIYFLDDSFSNHQLFNTDVTKFGLYKNKEIHQYLVCTPEEPNCQTPL